MSDSPPLPQPTHPAQPRVVPPTSAVRAQDPVAHGRLLSIAEPPSAERYVARVSLATLVAVLPDDVVVPIRWIRERLAEDARLALHAVVTTPDCIPQRESEPTMLTATEYGVRRVPARSTEWVRDACRAGRIPGAQKDGAEWMIPAAALHSERRPGRQPASAPTATESTHPRMTRHMHISEDARAKRTPGHARWGAP